MSKVDAIDVELRSDIVSEVIAQTKQTNTSSIASYHDFKQTPDLQILEFLVFQAKDLRGRYCQNRHSSQHTSRLTNLSHFNSHSC